MKRLASRGSLCGAMALFASAAHAQESLLIEPTVPDDFDRGRNVSVVDRPRPDYDPLGIQVGSFIVRPSVAANLGFDNNVFVSRTNRVEDGFALLSPRITATPTWSRHFLQLDASADLRRNFNRSERNENAYDVSLSGRLDATNEIILSGEANQSRIYESPLNGSVEAPISALSNYDRSFVALRGEYRSGQARAFVATDYSYYNFRTVRFGNGTTIDQSDRDRDILRVTGQGEYALTPSASVFAQASYEYTDYDRPTLLTGGGAPNRGSNAVRVIAGLNFDLAGFLRGSIGAGYVNRNFQAAQYGSVSGISADAKLEWFPSELTTFTLFARRIIADSSISTTNAYFDNRAGLRVDHELLRNLLLNAAGEVAYIDYIDRPLHSWIYRLSAGGRYLISNNASLSATMSYSNRTSNAVTLGSAFNQFRGQVGITFAL